MAILGGGGEYVPSAAQLTVPGWGLSPTWAGCVNLHSSNYPYQIVASGALTANTYDETIAVTGPGIIRTVGVSSADSTSRSVGLKIIIDGATVFDKTTDPISTAGNGSFAVGYMHGTYRESVFFEHIAFKQSLSLQIKSSRTETDKVNLLYMIA